jgi:hypothetical protein
LLKKFIHYPKFSLNFVYDVDELKEHWQKVTQSKTRIWINESLLKVGIWNVNYDFMLMLAK